MDIQGNEPSAFKGMISTLQACEEFILFFEHCPYLIESAGLDLSDYIHDLNSLQVDSIYEITNSKIVMLNGFHQLEHRFYQLIDQKEIRMQGSAANFIVVKNLKFPSILIDNN